MIPLASVEPWPLSAGVALGALIAFLIVGVVHRGRSVRTVPICVLTLGIVGWLLESLRVWGERSPIRLHAGWTNSPQAWQWTALLVLSLMGVMLLAGVMRASAYGHRRIATGLALAAIASFICWSAAVNSSVAFPVVLLASYITSATLMIATAPAPGPAPHAAMSGRLLVVTASACIPLWLLLSLLWLALKQGENVVCQCWEDNPHAWQYSGQFVLAILASAGWIAAVTSYLRVRPRRAASLALLSALATSFWLLFPITT